MKKKINIVLNRSDAGDRRIIEGLAKKYQTEIIAKIPYSKSIFSRTIKGEPIEDKNIDKIIKKLYQ
jgi:MinD superfamily P-loop ATPase